jgi:flagellar M-ring protein FliF
MANKLNEQVLPFLNLFSRGRTLMILFVLLFSVLLFGYLIFWNTQPDHQVLFTGLSAEDAGEMANKLKEKKIPFRLSHNGTTLLVPSEQVYDLRLSLAAEGLPRGGGVGFEVFDRNSIGVTDFVQRLNYQRALQGELSRTIKQIKEVEQVRVHIATPRESLFVEEQKKPTASVFVKTRSGMTLNATQVEGIVHLVASAVEGLEPGNISIVDMSGKVLSKRASSTPIGQLTTTQLEYQQSIEEGLRKKVQGMLEEILGPGKAIARISTEVDFQQVVVTEEKFDPNTVLRSEQRNVEKPASQPKPAGIRQEAGSESKTAPPAPSSQQWAVNPMERQNEIRNYEISKVNKQIRSPVGGIKKISAAVVIDGIYKEEAGAKENKEKKYAPRSQDEMKHLENIVKKAIGYNDERGDQVEVINLPFYWSTADEEIKTEKGGSYQDYLPMIYKPAISLVLVLLFIFFVLRPILKKRSTERGQNASLLQATVPGMIPVEMPSDRTPMTALNPRDHALQLVQKEPSKAVGVLRSWLHEKE